MVRKVSGRWTRSTRDGRPIFFMSAIVDAKIGEAEASYKVLFFYRKKGDKPKLLSVKGIIPSTVIREIGAEAEAILKAKASSTSIREDL